MNKFQLDARLEADCFAICDLELSSVLLMNDTRWPWLVLVPRIHNAVEIHKLDKAEQAMLHREVSCVADILCDLSQCEKLNIASLGNIVRQLHVHVVARNAGDANWPGPVWGFGRRQAYDSESSNKLIAELKKRLS